MSTLATVPPSVHPSEHRWLDARDANDTLDGALEAYHSGGFSDEPATYEPTPQDWDDFDRHHAEQDAMSITSPIDAAGERILKACPGAHLMLTREFSHHFGDAYTNGTIRYDRYSGVINEDRGPWHHVVIARDSLAEVEAELVAAWDERLAAKAAEGRAA